MLQFLHPVWLWVISGIIIPLIIHLWNIRQGKVLKVGSIAFLQNSSKQYAKSFKINEWLLLLLRCLLIIIASLLVAGPTWKKVATTKEKGWLLVDKQGFNEGYKTYKPVIDSLIKEGFAFHYFNEDFTTTTLPEALKDTNLNVGIQAVSYWNLIKKIDKTIPENLPVYLITDNQLKHFIGERPTVQNNIHWLTYLLKDSVDKHIVKAYLTEDDSIKLIISNSTPTANYFSYENLSSKTQSSGDYTTNFQNGNLFVRHKNDSAFLVDTSTLKIAIYAAQNGNDAIYLKAALSAIQIFTKRKIKLQIAKNEQEIPAKQDWLFWLSSKELPKSIDAKNIFAYAGDKDENTNSWINTLTSNIDNNNIKLLKRTVPAKVSASSDIIWQDGFGNAVLSKEINQQSNIYSFYNRFDPAWSNLVWDNSFPTLLAAVLFNEDAIAKIDDKRIIDEQQLQPDFKTTTNNPTTQIEANASEISNIFWMSLLIIFLAERIVSFHTKKGDA